MSADIHELIALHALDLLDPAEVAQVTAAIKADPKLEAELVALREAAHTLAAAGPAVAAPADVGNQLMAAVGGGKLEKYSSHVAKMFDVTVDRARELLALTERVSSWETPIPGIGLIHFEGGPACATADCGFVRISPGGTFPWHTHRGDELSIIVAGTLRDYDGKLFRPGDEVFHAAGSQHELTVEGNEDVIYIARAFDGIELGARP